MHKCQDMLAKFLKMEKELCLFDLSVGGAPVWEYLRFPLYRELLERSNLHMKAHTIRTGKLDQLKMIPMLVWNSLFKNAAFGGRKELLVFSHPRKKLIGKEYSDIYTDFLLDELPSLQVIEGSFYEGKHLTPPRNKEVKYLDFLEIAGMLHRKSLSTTEQIVMEVSLEKLRSRMETDFNLDIPVLKRVESILKARSKYWWIMNKVLDVYQPKLVLEVCHYGMEMLVLNEVCKKRGIPTVELQHGTMGSGHLAYSFPKHCVDLKTFPDHLLLFGRYWQDCTSLPISPENISIIGYPFLSAECKTHLSNGGGAFSVNELNLGPLSTRVLFISQGTIGKDLSRFAVDFAVKPEARDCQVFYKLHPGEYARWRKEYPWLAKCQRITILDDDATPLYKRFRRMDILIGVYSTAVYEWLCFGRKTFIVKLPGYEAMKDLEKNKVVTMVSTADELIKKLDLNGSVFDAEYYFKKYDKNIKDTLAKIISK